ncbi:hypothetical protein AL035_15720 [Salipiger aestuarii]|nr:hypothetical protein C357_18242 [Citreicella sp. 357]KAB2540819.1 hypothetical protein AL035_15720 [Salipiger aestuarii]
MQQSRPEDIADALDQQKGLATALVDYLGQIRLPADQEVVVLALIRAQDHCRNIAGDLAGNIARQDLN